MSMSTLVLTVLGDDRPGLVSALSAPLKAHGAGWERSQMAHLAGKFAGIVEVAVPTAEVDRLVVALESLASEGLHVHAERSGPTTSEPSTEAGTLTLDLLGADRPGIVADVSALLAQADVSIEELSTQVREAPMAGGLLFEARATLSAPAGADAAALRAALEQLADELMVEVTLASDETD